MAILGAHESISGGYDKAVDRARLCGCDCVQLFTKNNNQWAAADITADQARRFSDALDTFGITHPLAHDSYLINLASPDNRLWRKSVDAFVAELHRAEILKIPYVVTHPGAFTTADEPTGLQNIIRALDEVADQTAALKAQCLLETTAGQGTALGWRFEHFAAILDRLKQPERLGFCLDTCHVFAAGYPMGTPPEYQATLAAFDRLIGLDRIKAFHLNDSRRARQPRRPSRAHRPRTSRPRTLPAAPLRSPLPKRPDVFGDSQGRRGWPRPRRRESPRVAKLHRSVAASAELTAGIDGPKAL